MFTDFQACVIFQCRDTFHSGMRSTISYWPFGSLSPLNSREQYCYHSYTASIWTSAFNSLEGKWVKLANHIVLFILGIPQLSHSRNIHIPSSHVNTFPISPLFKPMPSIVMSSWLLKRHKAALVGLKSRYFLEKLMTWNTIQCPLEKYLSKSLALFIYFGFVWLPGTPCALYNRLLSEVYCGIF